MASVASSPLGLPNASSPRFQPSGHLRRQVFTAKPRSCRPPSRCASCDPVDPQPGLPSTVPPLPLYGAWRRPKPYKCTHTQGRRSMVRVASSLHGPPNALPLCLQPPARLRPLILTAKPRKRRLPGCCANSGSVNPQPGPPSTDTPVAKSDLVTEDKTEPSSVSQNAEFTLYPNKDINRRVALISTLGAVGLFFSTRLEFGVSLKDLNASAITYEEALSNGLPTVVEFYADWCEVCRELAPDVYKVEQQYKDRVNFVMLNVDNTKWEQELDEFGVEGIPHFAFLDRDGNEEGSVVGKLPKQYLLENVAALANGEPTIPHARVVGRYSNAESRKVHQVTDPLSHGFK